MAFGGATSSCKSRHWYPAAALAGAASLAVACRGWQQARRSARRTVLLRTLRVVRWQAKRSPPAVPARAGELEPAAGDPEVPEQDEPGNAWELGVRVFHRELGQLLLSLRGGPLDEAARGAQEALKLEEPRPLRPPFAFVRKLVLDADAVARREEIRGTPESTPLVKAIFFLLSWALDRLYEGRPIQKFWVLETVARLPYFSYITVLHLYESLGWWRTPQIRHLHVAEEDNELHHLLIMEALGGNSEWFDRFAAQHAALAYYWIVVALFMASPELAYNFSLLVEEHAYVTYSEFVEANREILKLVPPPPVAWEYYVAGDLYYFDKFQAARKGPHGLQAAPQRRPPCENLLDVFENIRDDEYEHILTMKACQDWWAGDGPSPLEKQGALGKREDWVKWSAQVNSQSWAKK